MLNRLEERYGDYFNIANFILICFAVPQLVVGNLMVVFNVIKNTEQFIGFYLQMIPIVLAILILKAIVETYDDPTYA